MARTNGRGKYIWLILPVGMMIGIFLMWGGEKALTYTSTDIYCASCHIHPHAEDSWKKSSHFYNKSGVKVHCVDCHLPPKGSFKYLAVKTKTGLNDLYGYYFKDSASFKWQSKRELEHAVKIVYNESCIKCHQTLFSKGLSTEGGTAHLYYENNAEKLNLQCINCHLYVGHYNPNYKHQKMQGLPVAATSKVLFTEPATVTSFTSFTEHIPNTAIAFNMVPVKGGAFKMGSDEQEALRNKDESPVRAVTVTPFFMGEVEVTWDEYWAFYASTMSEGRLDPVKVMEKNSGNPDAISGPTPPFGIPDQGWGSGARPAITMTHYGAQTYCQWLSKVTGKKYRLPTEAEWEYACRAGTETPYFFKGDPKRFVDKGLRNRILGVDTTLINSYTVYSLNSSGMTQEPAFVKANPFGLKNMAGNVAEYCSDWYSPEAYKATGTTVADPKGPDSGEEHVVRGGNYNSEAGSLRSAARDFTQTANWLKTDPQQPKSIWWFSDIKGIGFRVVCEADGLK
ncbi:MAG: SUMF1/EgtB/PvdO family nonheme iron enzyme [Prolixibacteraceae bacterium]